MGSFSIDVVKAKKKRSTSSLTNAEVAVIRERMDQAEDKEAKAIMDEYNISLMGLVMLTTLTRRKDVRL